MTKSNLILNNIAAFIFLFLICCIKVSGQSIRGIIIDSASGKRLATASVYINNTSIGTVTNDNGEFTLDNLAQSRFDLAVSYVGYETKLFSFTSLPQDTLLIRLLPKSDELAEVVISNFDKNGWERWGFRFKNSFIGTTPIGDNCIIKNPKDLRFSFSESNRLLKVYAVNPLVIVNKTLGYRITYELVQYENDMQNNMVIYTGYVRFEELKGGTRKKKIWKLRRKEAYEGSLMHFMRAVHSKRIEDSGFIIQKLVRKVNAGADILYRDSLQFSDVASATANNEVMLNFKDYLLISYPSKKPLNAYIEITRQFIPCITSELTLSTPEPVTITSVGSFFDPVNVITGGYWSWSEKVSRILPYDYMP